MNKSFNLVVDITANNRNLSEIEFREQIALCISYLHALKGAFDKEPCKVFFFPPGQDGENSKLWSVRCVVMIWVGKERGQYLLELYDAIVNLIIFELPDFEVRAEIAEMVLS